MVFKKLNILLVLFLMLGCSSSNKTVVKNKNDKTQEIKLMSKNGKDYIYLPAKEIKDYTVVADNNSLKIDVNSKKNINNVKLAGDDEADLRHMWDIRF